MSVFPDEIYAAPRSWTERAYPRLIHYNKLEKGGHFAAWEQPQLFAEELRVAFRSLRCADGQPPCGTLSTSSAADGSPGPHH